MFALNGLNRVIINWVSFDPKLTSPARKLVLCTLICLYSGRAFTGSMYSDGQIHFCSTREEKLLEFLTVACLTE